MKSPKTNRRRKPKPLNKIGRNRLVRHLIDQAHITRWTSKGPIQHIRVPSLGFNYQLIRAFEIAAEKIKEDGEWAKVLCKVERRLDYENVIQITLGLFRTN